MKRKTGWFAALLILALLVAACGPTMTTPTPSDNPAGGETATTAPEANAPTEAPTGNSPTAAPTQGQAPTAEAVSPGDLPVSADDWHVLGPADAKVTIIEYSDFQ